MPDRTDGPDVQDGEGARFPGTGDPVTADERPDGEAAVAPDEVLEAARGGRLRGGQPGDARDGTADGDEDNPTQSVQEPAKVLRIGSMVKTLLDEVRAAPLDEKSRVRLKEIYEQSIHDLAEGLSPDLVQELESLAPPFDSDAPSEAELRIAQAQLRVAKAQLVGWLEGLFHGIQATLMAQQFAARQQLEGMRAQLPQGPGGPGPGGNQGSIGGPGYI